MEPVAEVGNVTNITNGNWVNCKDIIVKLLVVNMHLPAEKPNRVITRLFLFKAVGWLYIS